MLAIYNTLTAKKEPFIPLKNKQVNMYTCGVTVYDKCHIGHGRSLYIFEVIKRYLEFKGLKVALIRNITDIDDKIIAKANELRTKKPGLDIIAAANEVTSANTTAYYADLRNLSLPKADIEPKATGHIAEMIRFIQDLIDKGVAYNKAGNVYFRIKSFPTYGKLSKRDVEQMIAGSRIEIAEDKEDPLDFALWKKAKENEPSWDSPWGKGRPGWHIECSAMARKYAGDTLDIHGGGRDLIFPHHENELAQSEALTGKSFARYWIHHGLITVDKQKMAKSLGNFITLEDALGKYHSDTLKIFYLSATYHSPLDYSEEAIREAEKVRSRLMIIAERLTGYNHLDISILQNQTLKRVLGKLTEAMDDDLNMPLAFSAIFDLAAFVNDCLVKGIKEGKELSEARTVFEIFKKLFVLNLSSEIKTSSDKEINILIEKRNSLRQARKFNEADAVRDELIQKGIILDDFPDGKTLWRRR